MKKRRLKIEGLEQERGKRFHTPVVTNDGDAVERIKSIWQDGGGRIHEREGDRFPVLDVVVLSLKARQRVRSGGHVLGDRKVLPRAHVLCNRSKFCSILISHGPHGMSIREHLQRMSNMTCSCGFEKMTVECTSV